MVGVVLTLLLTGCAAAAAPKPTPTVRTLTLAYIDDGRLDPAVGWFAAEVAKRSGGALTVAFKGECCGRGTDRTQKLIDGVASGKWDLGWAGTSDLVDLGATSVAPLTGPALIDSYATESAVLASAVPAGMLPGLDVLKVKGIAIEPGTIRRPISNGKALRVPADWKGRSFWALPSKTNGAAIAALGAKVTQADNDTRDDGLEGGTILGAENAVAWEVASQHVPSTSAVISIDQALWPRTSALIETPGLTLSAKEAGWLRDAAAATARRSSDVGAFDADQVAEGCSQGVRFARSTDAQRAAMASAFAPVVAAMPGGAATQRAVAAIRGLQVKPLPSEYSIPADCLAR